MGSMYKEKKWKYKISWLSHFKEIIRNWHTILGLNGYTVVFKGFFVQVLLTNFKRMECIPLITVKYFTKGYNSKAKIWKGAVGKIDIFLIKIIKRTSIEARRDNSA